jgi:hypothetical protein
MDHDGNFKVSSQAAIMMPGLQLRLRSQGSKAKPSTPAAWIHAFHASVKPSLLLSATIANFTACVRSGRSAK